LRFTELYYPLYMILYAVSGSGSSGFNMCRRKLTEPSHSKIGYVGKAGRLQYNKRVKKKRKEIQQ